MDKSYQHAVSVAAIRVIVEKIVEENVAAYVFLVDGAGDVYFHNP